MVILLPLLLLLLFSWRYQDRWSQAGNGMPAGDGNQRACFITKPKIATLKNRKQTEIKFCEVGHQKGRRHPLSTPDLHHYLFVCSFKCCPSWIVLLSTPLMLCHRNINSPSYFSAYFSHYTCGMLLKIVFFSFFIWRVTNEINFSTPKTSDLRER